jgi:hypothetical protein
LTHDYNIENLMTCVLCFAVYRIDVTLIISDQTTISNHTTKGEYNYG